MSSKFVDSPAKPHRILICDLLNKSNLKMNRLMGSNLVSFFLSFKYKERLITKSFLVD